MIIYEKIHKNILVNWNLTTYHEGSSTRPSGMYHWYTGIIQHNTYQWKWHCNNRHNVGQWWSKSSSTGTKNRCKDLWIVIIII